MHKLIGSAFVSVLLCLFATPVGAQSPSQYQQLARDVFRELIEIKSTESGVGSTPAAEAVARRLLAAGFPAADVQVIGPNDRKKNIVARLHGKGTGKPVLMLAHLDVVEARREDWSPDIDPFQLTERDGYFYGRGTQDIKDGASILVTNFIRWKKEGWVPDRDLILALTADEEGGNDNGVAWLLAHHRDLVEAEYALNTDSGDFQSKNGKPYAVTISAAEKRFAMLQLEAKNRGGHSSLPRKDNAIYELAAALQKLEALSFPPMLNEVTSAEFRALVSLETGQRAADMKAVAQQPADPAAVARLSEDPYFNALIRTTCVPTLLEGGHASNALPQRAIAHVNCRIVPGHAPEDVLRSVKQVLGDSPVEVTWEYLDRSDNRFTRFNPQIASVVERVGKQFWSGVVAIPVMETGGTDGRILRDAGIPTYGISGVFIDLDDVRSHGRDERIRVRDFYSGVDFYDRLAKTLVGPVSTAQ